MLTHPAYKLAGPHLILHLFVFLVTSPVVCKQSTRTIYCCVLVLLYEGLFFFLDIHNLLTDLRILVIITETPTLAQCFSVFSCHYFSILIAISVFSRKVGGGQKNQRSKKTFFFFRFSPSNFFSKSIFASILPFKLLFNLYMSNLQSSSNYNDLTIF